MARDAGIPFVGIAAGKYRRVPHASIVQKLSDVRSLALNARDLGRTTAGVASSLRHLRRFRPDVVFCKGGFVGLPVATAARMLGIPVVIHESDVVPGLGNKIVSRWAQAVAVGFPLQAYKTGSQPSLPLDKLIFTGNPVRPEITARAKPAALRSFGFSARRPVVLVMGGSQGAQTINNVVLDAAPELLGAVQILLICGQGELGRVTAKAKAAGIDKGKGLVIAPFVDADKMALALSAADVVLSRAGANTIAELAATSKPTILIPNRLMAAHQLVNAERLRRSGAAKVLREEDLTVRSLVQELEKLLADGEGQRKLATRLSAIYVAEAADMIAGLVAKVGEGR